ncbi:MAG: NADH-quinone oxidoreductase subunit L [Paludibacteraceae bacterium]
MELLTILLLILPLFGFFTIGILRNHLKGYYGGIIASAVVLINFMLACILFGYVSATNSVVQTHWFDWIKFGDVSINFDMTVDRLSALMLLVVNGVGFLIHVYSIEYMKGDDGINRFFSYMNLFIFFMLTLVLGSNYLMLFIGWEGVGLCSYLLIGFWYKDHENNNAARKAFIMNRIGDLGFLVALFFIFTNFKTLNISEVAYQASLLPQGNQLLNIITICLFIGATGKSAQIPLFTWLPDAMAGPTPVSALIHAATMVTAGIYLVVRSSVLFALSPLTLNIILAVGVVTAIVAGLIAFYQTDIKKILAYSTVSQLGFMFMALGLSSFSGAMFHLTTHAFFKALLFLAAGSVIHTLKNEQDIRKMGGLRKKIPYTFTLFIIGTIAISGIPPFAGFFSKETILSAAFGHSLAMGVIATFISLLTTIYMFRLLFIVFYKPASKEIKENSHIHESPKIMLIPMTFLAILSVIGGFIQLPELFSANQWFSNYLSPVLGTDKNMVSGNEHILSLGAEWMILVVPLLLIAGLVFICYKLFTNEKQFTEPKGIAKILAHKFYFDEIYDSLIVKPVGKLSDFSRVVLDQTIINSFVNGVGKVTLFAGSKVRLMQTGNIGFYLFVMVFCIIAILFFNILF